MLPRIDLRLGLVALLLAGCGGTTSTASTGSAAGSPTASPSASPTGGSAGVTSGSSCDAVRSFLTQAAADLEGIPAALASPGGSTSPDDQRRRAGDSFSKLADGLHKLAASAPAEIAGDVQYLASAIEDIAKALGQAGSVPSEQALQTLSRLPSDPRFQAAVTHLTQFGARSCGITPPVPGAPGMGLP